MDRLLAVVKQIVFSDETLEERRYRLASFLIKVYSWAKDNYELEDIRMSSSGGSGQQNGGFGVGLSVRNASRALQLLVRVSHPRNLALYVVWRFAANPQALENWAQFHEQVVQDWAMMTFEEKVAFLQDNDPTFPIQ